LPRIEAVLVEDDLETQVKVIDILARLGYDVEPFSDSLSARGHADGSNIPDLIVLDRNIPYAAGGADSSKIGDELLDYMWAKYPDSAFIVFTGKADIEGIHHALRERGNLTLEPGLSIARVQHFTKQETLKFRAAALKIAQHFARLNAVEVIGVTSDELESRILKRVAFHFQGESVTATKLEDGSTSDQVWKCRVVAGFAPVADIVVKVSRKSVPIGSFQAMLPASTLVARSLVTLTGLLHGRVVTVYSSAGEVTGSLHDEIALRPDRAAKFVGEVADGLKVIVEAHGHVERLQHLVTPYITWEDLEGRISALGLTPPSPSLPITSLTYAQHGDLHPGNILICGEQAIIIDLDSQTMGSGLVDPIALFWGAVFNKNSKIKNSPWPSEALCASFPQPKDKAGSQQLKESLQGCPHPEWVLAVWDWIGSRAASPREYWALTLAFAARQLKYSDIRDSALQRSRVDALIRRAVAALAN